MLATIKLTLTFTLTFFTLTFYTLTFYTITFYTLTFYTLTFYTLTFYPLTFYTLTFYTLTFYTLTFYNLTFYPLTFYTLTFYTLTFASIHILILSNLHILSTLSSYVLDYHLCTLSLQSMCSLFFKMFKTILNWKKYYYCSLKYSIFYQG